MTLSDSAKYRRIVENLRSGIPSPRVASHFPMGREHLLKTVSERLDTAGQGHPASLFIQANYGEGKTHLLHAIWNMAISQNFVVSSVALSKEASLDKLDRLYTKLVANTYVPGSSQPGLDQLLFDYRPGHQRAETLLAWAESELHPKVYAVLRNRIEGGETSADALDKLDQDLSGVSISMPDLKSIHRLNFREPLRISPAFNPKKDMFDYFRLLEQLILLAGYRGWVILLDEAELISRLGRGGRAMSYAVLARLSGEGGPQKWPVLQHSFTVVAVASNFLTEVLLQRNDGDSAPAWLNERGRYDEAEQARWAIHALRQAELLTPLTDDQLSQVMERIVVAHKLAYGWEPGISGTELAQKVARIVPNVDAKLRTRIRAAIQWLDLRNQYGMEPAISIGSLEEETAFPEQTEEESRLPE